ncbi:hypothetical protein ACWCPM_01215 [Streptomyces sp. NPDC002309]
MNTGTPGRYSWIPWVSSSFFSATLGATTWTLTAEARAYCDAGYEAGGRLELNFLLPVTMVGGALIGLAAYAVGRLLTLRAPVAVRIGVPTLLVLVTPVLWAWWFFATKGTLDGYPGDSGLCPASNIPPWWPDWIPA